MHKESLQSLRKLVDKELSIVDVYRHPIEKRDINQIRKCFGDEYHLKIESSHILRPISLSNKYFAVFTEL